MKLENVQSMIVAGCLWACVWSAALSPGLAAGSPGTGSPSIGTAVTKGSLRLDGATVAGNATLFEGATVETHVFASALSLSTGPRFELDADSRAKVFGDRLILERGSGELRNGAGFRVEARGLTVRTETGHAAARIRLDGATRIQVAALDGSLRVLNGRGVLVAEMNPGMALAFEPQLPGNASTGAAGEQEKLTGCLRSAQGHYTLTDEITNVTVELAGSSAAKGGTDLSKEGGNRVQVTGLMDPTGAPVSGATQYVRITSLKRLNRGCPANKAVAAGAGGAPNRGAGGAPNNGAGGAPNNGAGGAPTPGAGNAGGAAGAGAGGGAASVGGVSATVIAVVGGVAAAAVVGGLAATGTFSGSSQVSR